MKLTGDLPVDLRFGKKGLKIDKYDELK